MNNNATLGNVDRSARNEWETSQCQDLLAVPAEGKMDEDCADLSDECMLDSDSDDHIVDDHEGASDKAFNSSSDEELLSDISLDESSSPVSGTNAKCANSDNVVVDEKRKKSQIEAIVMSCGSDSDEDIKAMEELEGKLMQEAKEVKVLSSDEDSDTDKPLSFLASEKKASEPEQPPGEQSAVPEQQPECQPEIDWGEAAQRLLAEAAAEEERNKQEKLKDTLQGEAPVISDYKLESEPAQPSTETPDKTGEAPVAKDSVDVNKDKPKKKRKRKPSGEGQSKKAKISSNDQNDDGHEGDDEGKGETTTEKKKKSKKKTDKEGTKKSKKKKEGGQEGEEGEKKKKKKKKKKDEDGTTEGEGEEKEKKKKKKRKKKKSESADSDDDHSEKKRKNSYERRNIRKVISDEDVDAETLNAQKEEMERKKRLQETQQRFLQEQEREREREIERTCSELKSLLEEPLEPLDEQAEDSSSADLIKQMPVVIKQEKDEKIKIEPKEKKEDVIELSSSDDDNDVMVVPSEPEEESDEEDPNNSGSHVNDALNQPDMDGNVLVNVGHPENEPGLFLAPQLSAYVKPHQIGGIRFLYDNLVESLERYKSSNGFGCILAHSMGLGKTVQVIAFIDIFLRYTGAKRVLLIVPVNTLQNWLHEFNMWLPHHKQLLEEENKKKEEEEKAKEKERQDKEKKEKAERDKEKRAERDKERAAKRKNSSHNQSSSFNTSSNDPYAFPGMPDMPPNMPPNGPGSYMSNSGYPGYPGMSGGSQGWGGMHNGPPGYMGSNRHYGYPGSMGANPYGYGGMQGSGYPYPGGMHNNYNGGYMDRGFGMHGSDPLSGYPGMSQSPGYSQPFNNFSGQSGLHSGSSGDSSSFPPNCPQNFSQGSGSSGYSSNMGYPPSNSSASFPPFSNYPPATTSNSFTNSGSTCMDSQGSFSQQSNSSDFLSMGSQNSSAGQNSTTGTAHADSKLKEQQDIIDQLLDRKSEKPEPESAQDTKPTEEKKPSINDFTDSKLECKTESKPDVKSEMVKREDVDKKPDVGEKNVETKTDTSESKPIKDEKEIKQENGEPSEKKVDVKKEGDDAKETEKKEEEPDYDTLWPDLRPRQFDVYIVNDSHKTPAARAKVVGEWHEKGGALLMGYEMYRLLTSKRAYAPKKKSKKDAKKDAVPEIIDVEEEDKNKELALGMYDQLVKPGPDLIICDEGHRIKNSHASISQALKNVRTKRRVVLTGYPLQNNLLEYWCMVDFVRPNFLGSKTEFCNMFERPIMNGQCVDSTPQDVKLMRFRSHVLHSLLEGFVQRRGHTVLRRSLPEKEEYVFLVKMSPIQCKLYSKFMDSIKSTGLTAWASNNPIKAFSVCCKIWNHPDTLHQIVEQRKNDDDDLDIDQEAPEGTSKKRNSKKSKAVVNPTSKNSGTLTPSAGSSSLNPATPGGCSTPTPSMSGTATPLIPEDSVSSPPSLTPSQSATDLASSVPPSPCPSTVSTASQNPAGQDDIPNPLGDKKGEQISYEWAYDIMKDYKKGVEESGPKIVLLMSLVAETLKVGDKMLIFSQSLYTLNLIEYFLGQREIPVSGREGEKWAKNKSYFRLDGSTSASEREKLINQFNDPDSKILLFLLSTRAGCLGINLIGANRVVVMDASWNPCHDCQAVCRVYRYGQAKKCYIYRLVTDNCMEKRIYDRQINKQGISDRVVDELHPEMHFTRTQVEKLMDYEEKDLPHIEADCAKDITDEVLKTVIAQHYHYITKNPFTHESLLIDRKDQKLTKTEKKLAKQGYEMEKKLSINYSRPSYSAFYPKTINPMDPPRFPPPRVTVINPGRPVASVRPMMSTPLPGMHARAGGGNLPISSLLRPGVSVHQVQTTTDIVIPGTATATQSGASAGSRIPAGETVLVIKTPKGVYIRTNQGKIFAVRTAPKAGDTSAKTSQSPSSSGSVTTTMPKAIAGMSNPGTKTVTVVTPSGGLVQGGRPIIISSQGRYAQLVKTAKDQVLAASGLKSGQTPTIVRVVQNTNKLLDQAKRDADRRAGKLLFVKDMPDMKKVGMDAQKLAALAVAQKARLKAEEKLEQTERKETEKADSEEDKSAKEESMSQKSSDSDYGADQTSEKKDSQADKSSADISKEETDQKAQGGSSPAAPPLKAESSENGAKDLQVPPMESGSIKPEKKEREKPHLAPADKPKIETQVTSVASHPETKHKSPTKEPKSKSEERQYVPPVDPPQVQEGPKWHVNPSALPDSMSHHKNTDAEPVQNIGRSPSNVPPAQEHVKSNQLSPKMQPRSPYGSPPYHHQPYMSSMPLGQSSQPGSGQPHPGQPMSMGYMMGSMGMSHPLSANQSMPDGGPPMSSHYGHPGQQPPSAPRPGPMRGLSPPGPPSQTPGRSGQHPAMGATQAVSEPTQSGPSPGQMQRSPMQTSPATQQSPQAQPLPQIRGPQYPQHQSPQQPSIPVQQPLPSQRQHPMSQHPMVPPQTAPPPHMSQPSQMSQPPPSPKEEKKKKPRKRSSKKSKEAEPPPQNSSIERLKEMSQGLPVSPPTDSLSSFKYGGSEELSRFLPPEPSRFPSSDPLRFGPDSRPGLFPPEPSKFGAPESSVFGSAGDMSSPYMGSSYNSMAHSSQLGSSMPTPGYGSYSSGLHGSSLSHLGMPPAYGQYPSPGWGYGANMASPSAMWPHGSMHSSMQNSAVYGGQASSYDNQSYSAAAALRDLDKKLDSTPYSSSASSFLEPMSQPSMSTPTTQTTSSFDVPSHNPYTSSYSSYPPYCYSSYLPPPPPSMYMGSGSYMPSTTTSNPYSQSYSMPDMYPPPPDSMLSNNPFP